MARVPFTSATRKALRRVNLLWMQWRLHEGNRAVARPPHSVYCI